MEKILSWRSTAVKSLPNYLFRPVAIQSFAKMEKIKQSGMGQVSGNEIIVPARSAMIIHQ